MEEIIEIPIPTIELINNHFSDVYLYVDIGDFKRKIESFFKQYINNIIDDFKLELITDFIRKYIFQFLRPDLLKENQEVYKKHYLNFLLILDYINDNFKKELISNTFYNGPFLFNIEEIQNNFHISDDTGNCAFTSIFMYFYENYKNEYNPIFNLIFKDIYSIFGQFQKISFDQKTHFDIMKINNFDMLLYIILSTFVFLRTYFITYNSFSLIQFNNFLNTFFILGDFKSHQDLLPNISINYFEYSDVHWINAKSYKITYKENEGYYWPISEFDACLLPIVAKVIIIYPALNVKHLIVIKFDKMNEIMQIYDPITRPYSIKYKHIKTNEFNGYYLPLEVNQRPTFKLFQIGTDNEIEISPLYDSFLDTFIPNLESYTDADKLNLFLIDCNLKDPILRMNIEIPTNEDKILKYSYLFSNNDELEDSYFQIKKLNRNTDNEIDNNDFDTWLNNMFIKITNINQFKSENDHKLIIEKLIRSRSNSRDRYRNHDNYDRRNRHDYNRYDSHRRDYSRYDRHRYDDNYKRDSHDDSRHNRHRYDDYNRYDSHRRNYNSYDDYRYDDYNELDDKKYNSYYKPQKGGNQFYQISNLTAYENFITCCNNIIKKDIITNDINNNKIDSETCKKIINSIINNHFYLSNENFILQIDDYMYYKNGIFIKLIKQKIKTHDQKEQLSVYSIDENNKITFKELIIDNSINEHEFNFVADYLFSKGLIQNQLLGSSKKNNIIILFIILLILIIIIIIIVSLIIKICVKNTNPKIKL